MASTVLQIANDALTSLGIEEVTTLFGTSATTDAKRIRQAIADASSFIRQYDWQELQTLHTMTGTGLIKEFDLPSDFSRILPSTALSTTNLVGLHPLSPDQWQYLTNYGVSDNRLFYTIYGNKFRFLKNLSTNETVTYFYISNNVFKNGTTDKSTADDNTDLINVSDDVMRLAVKAMYARTNSLSNANSYLAEYNNFVAKVQGTNTPRPVIDFSDTPIASSSITAKDYNTVTTV